MQDTDLFSIPLRRLDGQPSALEDFRGDVLLIVNVASQCGLTPQYEGLQQLYHKHEAEGFEVLAFPCNQFGAQEPGSADEIAQFCSTRYQVSFPMFEKIQVNGDDSHPLYAALKELSAGTDGPQDIQWNFEKFLLNRSGNLVKRYSPRVPPEELEADIVALLTT